MESCWFFVHGETMAVTRQTEIGSQVNREDFTWIVALKTFKHLYRFPLVSILYEFHEFHEFDKFDEFYLIYLSIYLSNPIPSHPIPSHPILSYPILSYHPDIPNSPAGDPCRQQHHRLPAAAQRSTGGGTHQSVSHRGEDAERVPKTSGNMVISPRNMGISWEFHGNFMGISWEFHGIYPLVNIQKTMERSTMLLMGKLTISTGPFSIAMLNYQRVWVMYG